MTLWVWAHTGDLTLTLEDRMPPTSSYILLKTVSGFWEILTSHRELRTARTSGLARWWTVVSATTSASTQLAKAAVLGEEPQNWLQQKICFFRVSPYSLDFKVTSFTRGHLDGFIMFHQSFEVQTAACTNHWWCEAWLIEIQLEFGSFSAAAKRVWWVPGNSWSVGFALEILADLSRQQP